MPPNIIITDGVGTVTPRPSVEGTYVATFAGLRRPFADEGPIANLNNRIFHFNGEQGSPGLAQSIAIREVLSSAGPYRPVQPATNNQNYQEPERLKGPVARLPV